MLSKRAMLHRSDLPRMKRPSWVQLITTPMQQLPRFPDPRVGLRPAELERYNAKFEQHRATRRAR